MGFSPEWLALREPADHAARDTDLLRSAALAAGSNPVILDLGCGTGSTVRALVPFLANSAKWRLVDNDANLLELAGAEAGENSSLHSQDLQELDKLPLDGVTLVTASALLDLVSRKWLVELASVVGVPVYFALSYNGVMSWNPEDQFDEAVTKAFNTDQQTDKGFGKALGPQSVEVASEIFAASGFEVKVADSTWRLGAKDEKLQGELVAGIASAALKAGEPSAKKWGAARTAAAAKSSCNIGHGDILALPKSVVLEANNAAG